MQTKQIQTNKKNPEFKSSHHS